jgi:UDP-N-acetylglucosamine 2-epimerase (non-hydrolysing)
MQILHIVGTRPNFIKAAPVIHALKKLGVPQTVIHTGQHYDANMSEVFLAQLDMPLPDVNLGVGSGSHAQQTAAIMARLESELLTRKPDIVAVYGDVNSTLAAALLCAKVGIRVAHVEAGLRSFDRTMPEEVNRLVTDQLADLLFTHSEDGDANLLREGIDPLRIHRVGNVMIDSLVRLLPLAKMRDRNGFPERYILATIHRPSNVDDRMQLQRILESIAQVCDYLPVIFPVHPRTRQRMLQLGLKLDQIQWLDPLPYVEFLALQMRATAILTDSGGIQEESTYLGVPCLTMRDNTERPITIDQGTNVLVGTDWNKLHKELCKILNGHPKQGSRPPLWDGYASERISAILLRK